MLTQFFGGRRWLIPLLLSVFLGFLTNFLKPEKLQTLEDSLSISILNLRPSTVNGEGVFLDVSTSAVLQTGYPIPRSIYAKILSHKNLQGIPVFIDVLFGESSDIAGTSLFQTAMSSHRNVFLPAVTSHLVSAEFQVLESGNIFKTTGDCHFTKHNLEGPSPALLKSSGGLYLSEVEVDHDGILRWYPLFKDTNFGIVPSAALSTFLSSVRKDISSLTVEIQCSGGRVRGLTVNSDDRQLYSWDLTADPHGLGRVLLHGKDAGFRRVDLFDILVGDEQSMPMQAGPVFLAFTAEGMSSVQPSSVGSLAKPVENTLRAFAILKSAQIIKTNFSLLFNTLIILFILVPIFLIKKFGGGSLSKSFFLWFTNFISFGFILFLLTYYLVDIAILNSLIIFGIASIYIAVSSFSKVEREKRVVTSSFKKYLHPILIDRILQGNSLEDLRGTKNNIAIVFIDLRNFTNLTESIEPTKFVSMINVYLEFTSELIIKHNGTVDKFIGDAVMAFWGAPVKDQNSKTNAMNFIEEFVRSSDLVRSSWSEMSPGAGELFDFGIGVHYGEAIVGNVGGISRFSYTALGDPVNVCSRIESLCKHYGLKVLFTEDISTSGVAIDKIRVKGKLLPVTIRSFWTFSSAGKEFFEIARDLYFSGDFVNAKESFRSLVEISPETSVLAYVFISRIDRIINNKVIDWNGVWSFDEK